MRRPHLRALALAAVAGGLALWLVACGGGASDATPAPDGVDAVVSKLPEGGAPPGPAGGAKLDCGGHGCGVKQIALGIIAGCALLEDKTVACYGGGIVGTLGHAAGDRPEIDPVPKRVPNLKNVAKIFGGGYSMCALLEDKTIACWGPDQSKGPYGARPSDFFVVEGLANVVELAVAISHTCAIVQGGDVYCFGSNYFGELGDGSLDNANKPVKAATISGAKAIATGAELSCAVVANGSVSCWGLNDQGQLGQGDMDKLIHPMPVTVPGLDGPAKSIAASSVSGAVCALFESGKTKCWGEKLAGDTGTSGGSYLAVGGNHACALDGSGAVSCWGANNKGQLGNASNTPVTAPASAVGLTGAIGLSAGGNSSCAVFASGAFSCWGDDSRGQLGGGQIGAIAPSPLQKHF